MLSAIHAVVRPSVCLCVSVTLRYCIKTAKRRITQIMQHDRPGTQLGCFVVAEFFTDKHVARFVCNSRVSCWSRDTSLASSLHVMHHCTYSTWLNDDWILCYLYISLLRICLYVDYFQVSTQNVGPNELHVGVSCHPHVAAVRGNMPYPGPEFTCPIQIPLNRPQHQPPSECAEQCYRPATCEPVLQPQPLPKQCLQQDDVYFLERSLQFSCRPHRHPPFEVPYVEFPRMECKAVVSCNKQPFFQADTADLQSLKDLPHTNRLNAVVSEGIFVRSCSESIVNKPVTPDQAKESCAVSEPMQTLNQSVIAGCRGNVDRSADQCYRSCSNMNICQTDEQKSRSQHRQRETRRSPQHCESLQPTRQSYGDSLLHADSHRCGSSRKYR